MEEHQEEIKAMILRLHGTGDLEVLLEMLDAYIDSAKYNRFSEEIYENPQRLQHWNGYEAFGEQFKHDIKEIVDPQ